MLIAAVRGELYRARRNRPVLFWAYWAVPLALVLFGAALDLVALVHLRGAPGQRSFADVATGPLYLAGNPFVHILYAAGAASLVAGEYRWETWRLIVPRSRRSLLIGAKLLVYVWLAGLALLFALVGATALRSVAEALSGGLERWTVDAATLLRLGAAFVASLLEIAVLGAFVAVAAVRSRSVLAATLVGFGASLMLTLALEYVGPLPPAGAGLALPPFAADVVRGWAEGEEALAAPALVGLALLAFWALLLNAAAVLAFRRQDLARE